MCLPGLLIKYIAQKVFKHLDQWYKIHGFESIYLIFVFDGRIDKCKVGRNIEHDSRQKELEKIRRRMLAADQDPDPKDVKRFRKLYRKSMRPNGQLVTDVLAWIKEKENLCAFGAPWQADAQMVSLFRQFSWFQGIISDDSDNFTMHVTDWHSGYSTCSNKKYRSVVRNKTKTAFMGKMSKDERSVCVCLFVFIYLYAHLLHS